MAISLKYAAVVAILIIGVSSYPAASGSRGPEHPLRREVYSEGRLFDITHVFRPDLPEWGRKTGVGPVVGLQYSMKNGSQTNNSWLKLAVHTGTHCDAPGHVFEDYFEQGFDVDSLDLTTLNGPAIVIDVPRNSNITADVLKQLNIPRGVKRVLFKTLNTDRRLMWKKEFDTSYVGFMTDGAQWLVDNTDIKLVGLDYISVAAFVNVVPAHVALLRNKDVVIIEGLKLDDIKPGTYNVHCLPLRLRGSEGSPTRCILIQ